MRLFRLFIFYSIILFFMSSAFADNQKTKGKPANTPEAPSVIQIRLEDQRLLANNSLGIIFYKPNYVLPFYYTQNPYQSIYKGHTPENQRVKKQEFKAQISFLIPLLQDMLKSGWGINLGYTQLFYWQFYAKSQYFRETNYEPEFFISKKIFYNSLLDAGVVHQSNGRGGSLERSWNRFFINYQLSGIKWLLSFKPWFLIFKSRSSDLHNPNISKYLGHERFMFAYKFNPFLTASIQVRNIEHAKYTTFEGDLSFPITKHINGYFQAFSGYGQSLLEYDHKTNGVGVGISLSNWI